MSITLEAIEIFRRLRAAKGEEYHELGWELHRVLNMWPWETRVADAADAKRPSWLSGLDTMGARTWEAARALWVELDAALAAERRAISSTDATIAPPQDAAE
jgi:hypothetical protein